MTLRPIPLARCLAWALVSSQLFTPVVLAQGTLPDAGSATVAEPDLKQQHDQWLASQASTLGGVLQEGNAGDYAKGQLQAIPQSALNDGISRGVSSRYPVERIEWSGDAALMTGLQQQGSINSPLVLPELPLDVTDSKEYSLYLTVTDSKGNTVTSERIPVTVAVNPENFRSHINVIHDEVRREDGKFVVPSPAVNDAAGSVVEWHYVRERSEDEWTSLKPENVHAVQQRHPGSDVQIPGRRGA